MKVVSVTTGCIGQTFKANTNKADSCPDNCGASSNLKFKGSIDKDTVSFKGLEANILKKVKSAIIGNDLDIARAALKGKILTPEDTKFIVNTVDEHIPIFARNAYKKALGVNPQVSAAKVASASS